MAPLTEQQIRAAAARWSKTADSGRADARDHYDVFLSHAFADKELVRGAAQTLREQGLSVYVDWLEEPELDRASVNFATANLLRSRMKSCDALIVAYTPQSVASRWVQWEMGYFDGLKGRVAVFPILPDDKRSAAAGFSGHEYFQLYPHLTWDPWVVNGQWTNVLVAAYGSMSTGMQMGNLAAWVKDGNMPKRRDPPTAMGTY